MRALMAETGDSLNCGDVVAQEFRQTYSVFLIILLSWLGLNELSCMGTGADLSQTQLVVFHRFPLAIRPFDYEKIGNAVQTS